MTTVSVEQALAALKRGDLVAIPTETVYGLAASVARPHAVARIFEVKGRPRFDPLIVHVSGEDSLSKVWSEVPARARDLAAAFWPGPLTIVAPRHPSIPDLVTAGLPRAAARVPDHPLTLQLLQKVGPLAAPSANRFGGISPTTARAVQAELGESVPVLDGGPCRVGVESTVVLLDGPKAVLLRPGGIPIEALEPVIGPVEIPDPRTELTLSPGRLPKHYAPATPVAWADDVAPHAHAGWLAFQTCGQRRGTCVVLSPTGDLVEAATRLFSALRTLDAAGVDVIGVEPVPERGLGRAIMDRLRRSMGKGAQAP